MDKIIKKVIQQIQDAGFKAYVVGGYTRDSLLGRITFDVDICTNALPKDIHAIFNISNSNNYGGSNLKIGKFNIDITTFRKELKYVGRKPVLMEYIDDLKMDLIRRDFTINAIVMDENDAFIDPLNGISDLEKRIIKIIGNPEERLREDPLRILRAIRFATVLDFEIEDSLYKAMKACAGYTATLSKMRIKQEMSKILLSKNFKNGLKMMKELGLDQVLGITYEDVIFTNDLQGMWAQVKICDIPFTNTEKSNIIKIAEVVQLGEISMATVYKYGLYVTTTAGSILGVSANTINNMYKKLPIKERKDIVVSGKDIIEILAIEDKRSVRFILDDIEEKIVNGILENSKMAIENYLKNK